MSKHSPEIWRLKENDRLTEIWRICFQDDLWLFDQLILAIARSLIASPHEVSIWLIEYFHSMVDVQKSKKEATLLFMTESQKLHIVTSAMSCWLYLLNLG